MDLISFALKSLPSNPKRVHSPFLLPVSGRNAFVVISPATPVCQFKFQLVSSTPNTNHTMNFVTGTLKDVFPRIKEELQNRQVPNLLIETF